MDVNYTVEPRSTINKVIKLLNYPVWIFDSITLTIIDGNKKAFEFCRYAMHNLIGLNIRKLWRGENLANILEDIDIHQFERSFFGNLKHRKSNGEIVNLRIHAERLSQDAYWVVHLIQKSYQK